MREAVRVRNLTKMFGDFTAVDDVTFSVERGEIFGFLGPNGAGKTTTIKMLTGLLPPTAGQGWVIDMDVSDRSREIKQRIGYMSQQFSLYADLTVSENIALYGGLYEVPAERLAERRAWVLEMAGLTDRTEALTGQLPLGWKQRLALGCAVLHDPEILFLDEPTSGVDPIARRAFWDLIDSMSEHGTTVFVSTHYMEEAEYCHRLALMNRGRLIAVDSPRDLRRRLTTPILALRTDNPARAVTILDGTPGTSDVSLFGRDVHVVVESEEEIREVLSTRLEEGGVECREISRVSPSLEDVFVALVHEQGGAVAG